MKTSDPKPFNPREAAIRLCAALDLMELGYELMRQNLVRRMPDASSEKINSELQSWIEKTDCYTVVRKNP